MDRLNRFVLVAAIMVATLAAGCGNQEARQRTLVGHFTRLGHGIDTLGRSIAELTGLATSARDKAEAARVAAVEADTAATRAAANATEAQRSSELAANNSAAVLDYTLPDRDGDEDDVLNRDDRCVNLNAGDYPDPRPDRHGCPQPDADRDRVGDFADMCPITPIARDADPLRPGCEDPDTDGDGVRDSEDLCWDRPKGDNPDATNAGCPNGAEVDPDTDGDGLRNRYDRCPTVAQGDHADTSRPGCPDGDDDNDGVLNSRDRCPTERANVTAEGNTPAYDAGRMDDPGRPGCLIHSVTELLTQDADASVTDASTSDPDSGAADTSTTDAAVTDAVPAQPEPPPVAEPTPTPTPEPITATPTNTLQGAPVATEIARQVNPDAASRFCAIPAREVSAAQRLATDASCARNQLCWRRTTDAVVPQCGPGVTVQGCVREDGTADVCAGGATNAWRLRCGEGVNCTPAGVTSITGVQPTAARPRTSRRHRRDDLRLTLDARVFGRALRAVLR